MTFFLSYAIRYQTRAANLIVNGPTLFFRRDEMKNITNYECGHLDAWIFSIRRPIYLFNIIFAWDSKGNKYEQPNLSFKMNKSIYSKFGLQTLSN